MEEKRRKWKQEEVGRDPFVLSIEKISSKVENDRLSPPLAFLSTSTP